MPDHSKHDNSEDEVPFFPNVLLAEMSLAVAAIGLLAIFVSLFPLKLGEKFDPMNPPSILEPEWYFMGVYQFLKTQGVVPLYGIIMMAVLGVFLISVPFIDRATERRPLRRPVFVAVALFVAVEFIGMTAYGYLSPGQVGSFSDPHFTAAFLLTNLVACSLVCAVAMATRRMREKA